MSKMVDFPVRYYLSLPGRVFHGYPLVNIQKAIENGPVEIVDLPIFIAW